MHLSAYLQCCFIHLDCFGVSPPVLEKMPFNGRGLMERKYMQPLTKMFVEFCGFIKGLSAGVDSVRLDVAFSVGETFRHTSG